MKKIVISILLCAVLLASCILVISTESELKLSQSEKWSFHYIITTSNEEATAYSDVIAQRFALLKQDASEKGIDFKWKKGGVDSDGNTTLIIDIKGTGYEKWNDYFDTPGSIETDEVLGKPVIKFHFDLDTVGQGTNNSFVLTGGRILSTNGNQVSATSVKWVDVGQMEAVMEIPKANSTFWIILIIPVILLLVLFSRKVGSKKSSDTNNSDLDTNSMHTVEWGRNLRNDRFIGDVSTQDMGFENKQSEVNNEIQFCGHCGEPWKRGGNFCTRCGNPKRNN